MKHALAIGALLAAWYPLSAQMQPPQQGQPGMPPGGAGTEPGMGARPATGNVRGMDTNNPPSRAMPMDDKSFLKQAAIDNRMQIEMGKLAAQKASNADVKQFGQKLADDQEKTAQELQQLAAKENVPMQNKLDAKHQAKIDKLAKLNGASFDKAFLKEQSHNSRDELEQFEAEAERGAHPDVKSFATRITPMLKAQRETAKDLQSGRNASSSADRQK